MFEKVNPAHPDKVADRIAGAIVDLAYSRNPNAHIAVEVLIGHGKCDILCESNTYIYRDEVNAIVDRISPAKMDVYFYVKKQDDHLAKNQQGKVRCGDNGIFRGVPVTDEQDRLASMAHNLYEKYKSDGKYIIDDKTQALIICQSNALTEELQEDYPGAKVNPLGDWTGGTDVDSGATNRKLGSDMGDAVTGGGLHGKDLSKADVSVNIWCHLLAQKLGHPVTAICAIGDEEVNGVPYEQIVEEARAYIQRLGGFEKFAEWGLI